MWVRMKLRVRVLYGRGFLISLSLSLGKEMNF